MFFSAMNFLANSLGCRRSHPSRETGWKKSIGCRSQGPRSRLADVPDFTLAFAALGPPPPLPPFAAWAAAINKSISTRWITFIRLETDCYPESRLMGKLILQRLVYVMGKPVKVPTGGENGAGCRQTGRLSPSTRHTLEFFPLKNRGMLTVLNTGA